MPTYPVIPTAWWGPWDAGQTYAAGDQVGYGGCSFVALAPSVGQAPITSPVPTPSAYWDIVSAPSGAGGGLTVTDGATSVPGAAILKITGGTVSADGSVAGQADVTITPATSYTFNQPVASASWAIAHNLARFPSVTIVDTAGDVVIGDITYVDANHVTLTFSAPFAGTAYLN